MPDDPVKTRRRMLATDLRHEADDWIRRAKPEMAQLLRLAAEVIALPAEELDDEQLMGGGEP